MLKVWFTNCCYSFDKLKVYYHYLCQSKVPAVGKHKKELVSVMNGGLFQDKHGRNIKCKKKKKKNQKWVSIWEWWKSLKSLPSARRIDWLWSWVCHWVSTAPSATVRNGPAGFWPCSARPGSPPIRGSWTSSRRAASPRPCWTPNVRICREGSSLAPYLSPAQQHTKKTSLLMALWLFIINSLL